jgi:hypothetical protein
MIASAFIYVVIAAVVTAVVGVVCTLVTYFLYGEPIATQFWQASMIKFNGVLVGGVGYGLLAFVRNWGKTTLAQLNEVLITPDEHAASWGAQLQRATSWRWVIAIAGPLTVVGGIVIWKAGVPFAGFPKFCLLTATISIYVVASSILAFFIYTIMAFRYIEMANEPSRFGLNCSFASLALQNIDSFFVISSTLGVLAIYLGFRGTLTANFVGNSDLFRKMMVLPLVFYLPATLFYSLYPRYVLRQISECDTLELIKELEQQCINETFDGLKAGLEFRKLVLDVKEKIVNDRRIVPLLGIRDAPSLTMSIIIVIQFVAQKDSVVAGFLNRFFN